MSSGPRRLEKRQRRPGSCNEEETLERINLKKVYLVLTDKGRNDLEHKTKPTAEPRHETTDLGQKPALRIVIGVGNNTGKLTEAVGPTPGTKKKFLRRPGLGVSLGSDGLFL